MQSTAKTPAEYLASLPADRRSAIDALRKVVLANCGPDIEEGMSYGMIGYCVPHRVYPAGYHCKPEQPLPYAGIASQKGYVSFYLMWMYGSETEQKWLVDAYRRAGKKLDMGKCCIRFKQIDEVPLDVLAEAVRRVPGRAYLTHYQALLDSRTGKPKSTRPKAQKPAAKKPAAKKPAAKGATKVGAKAKPKAAAKKPRAK